jgi:hypothetical protein
MKEGLVVVVGFSLEKMLGCGLENTVVFGFEASGSEVFMVEF